jgi:hypothetical protein
MRVRSVLVSFCLFALSLVLPISRATASDAPALPEAVTRLMNSYVDQGLCESRWPELAEGESVIRHDFRDGRELILVPCALWVYNLAWSAFVVFDEPSRPDGHLTRALIFVDDSRYEGLIGQPVAYNLRWNPTDLTLSTQYYWNGDTTCGSRARYRWQAGYDSFRLLKLERNDRCGDPEAPWIASMTH